MHGETEKVTGNPFHNKKDFVPAVTCHWMSSDDLT